MYTGVLLEWVAVIWITEREVLCSSPNVEQLDHQSAAEHLACSFKRNELFVWVCVTEMD